jgi:hypothetical protein
MNVIANLVQQLKLQPHPEGGFFAETYRAACMVNTPRGLRPASTAIYFLLTKDFFSAFHRIASDECWHHYKGDAVHIHQLFPSGHYHCAVLGKEVGKGEVQQTLVPAGVWFASECIGSAGYALTGCTVAPGFDFDDFDLARKQDLMEAFPPYKPLIERLCR